jgi:hypothetical protein
MTREELIQKNKDLFWYFDKSKLNKMSDLVLAEFILNYGDWQAFKDFAAHFGLKRAKALFQALKEQPRSGLFEENTSFFDHFFHRHAS